MNWLLRKLLRWSLGRTDSRVLLSELDEGYRKKAAADGRAAANRWGRWEMVRALAMACLSHKKRRSADRAQTLRIRAVGSLMQDLRFTLRSFGRKPAFFAVVLALFALGIGANTVIFSVVDAVILRPLPYPESERLVTTYQTIPDWLESDNPGLRAGWNRLGMSYPVYEDWLEMNEVFDALGIYARKTYVATGGDRPEWITGRAVSHGVFEALGVRPMLGRLFVPEDDQVGSPQLVVLSSGLWRRRFGSDSGVVGRTMTLDEQQYEIVGVMPRGFYFPDASDNELWTTFSDADRQRQRTNQFAQGIARLKPGLTLQFAQQGMEVVQERLADLYPHPSNPDRRYGVQLMSRKEVVVGDVRPALLLLFGAVGLVLLISCVNIASLLLIKTSERRRELAVRSSIGAGSWRLLRQLLTESLSLSVAGGVLGTSLAMVSVGPFVALLPPGTPRLSEIGVDMRVLAFAAGLAVMTGTFVGMLPALAVFRTPLSAVLKDSGRGTSGGRYRNRTQAALLVFEVALTFVLLVGAGLLAKSFWRLTSVDRGFEASGVVTMSIDPRGGRYESDEAVQAVYQNINDALRAVPGVTAAAVSVVGPFMGGWSNGSVVETDAGEVETNLYRNEVSASYFEVMGISLIRGRLFAPEEEAQVESVVVVSRGLEQTYWPGESAVGKRIRFGRITSETPWRTVVGVVADVRRQLGTEPYPTVYGTVDPYHRRRNVLLKVAIQPTAVIAATREAVNSVDPELPIANLNTLEERMSRSVAGPRVRSLLMGSLAGIAAVLSVVGIFGVLGYSVTQRTNEIGIRMALGAATTNVVRNVVNRGLVLLGSGVAIGLIVSLVAARAIEDFLFEVEPIDPLTLASVTTLLGLAALAASYLPARRAAKVDPVEALRRE